MMLMSKRARKSVFHILVLLLLLSYVSVGNLYIYGFIPVYPRYTRAMLLVALLHVLQGVITETLGFYKTSVFFGHIAFLALCILLFYSNSWWDLAVFIPCTTVILLHRAYNTYDEIRAEAAEVHNMREQRRKKRREARMKRKQPQFEVAGFHAMGTSPRAKK